MKFAIFPQNFAQVIGTFFSFAQNPSVWNAQYVTNPLTFETFKQRSIQTT